MPGIPARKQLIWVDGNLSLRLQRNMPHENPTGSQIWTLNRSSSLKLVTGHGWIHSLKMQDSDPEGCES